ncbi:carcinoembryonic antigen-related cell adhesion molecule 16-like [Elgaria multicarinata webbii]|uniref:carcinoembryonic antigen-related cell adhesion molecule 16-like n=1 Tax=Elgaria multicarinata webbii TaxID=159646 RepID=UPI002FCD5B13
MPQTGLAVLAVLSLASCLHPAEAVHIVPVPPNPPVGQTVTLSVRDIEHPTICFWFRGNKFNKSQMIIQVEYGRVVQRGGGATGRESLGNDCALVIQRLQPSDNGEYYLVTLQGNRSGQRWTDALARLQVSN